MRGDCRSGGSDIQEDRWRKVSYSVPSKGRPECLGVFPRPKTLQLSCLQEFLDCRRTSVSDNNSYHSPRLSPKCLVALSVIQAAHLVLWYATVSRPVNMDVPTKTTREKSGYRRRVLLFKGVYSWNMPRSVSRQGDERPAIHSATIVLL